MRYRLAILLVLLGALTLTVPGCRYEWWLPVATTVTVYASAETADTIVGQSADYSTARGTASYTLSSGFLDTGQAFTQPNVYAVMRSYLEFDTSGIPADATVTDAKLYLMVYFANSPTFCTIQISDCTWSSPITPVNREANYDAGLAATILADWRTTEGISTDTYYSSGGIPAGGISLGGTTQFGLISDRDRAATTPIEEEYVSFYSPGATVGKRPYLEITYTVPATEPEARMNRNQIVTAMRDYSGEWSSTRLTTPIATRILNGMIRELQQRTQYGQGTARVELTPGIMEYGMPTAMGRVKRVTWADPGSVTGAYDTTQDIGTVALAASGTTPNTNSFSGSYPGFVQIVSNAATQAGTAAVIGKDKDNVSKTETITLNGISSVVSTGMFRSISRYRGPARAAAGVAETLTFTSRQWTKTGERFTYEDMNERDRRSSEWAGDTQDWPTVYWLRGGLVGVHPPPTGTAANGAILLWGSKMPSTLSSGGSTADWLPADLQDGILCRGAAYKWMVSDDAGPSDKDRLAENKELYQAALVELKLRAQNASDEAQGSVTPADYYATHYRRR